MGLPMGLINCMNFLPYNMHEKRNQGPRILAVMLMFSLQRPFRFHLLQYRNKMDQGCLSEGT